MLGATGPQLVVTLGLVPAHGAEESPPPPLLLSSVPVTVVGGRNLPPTTVPAGRRAGLFSPPPDPSLVYPCLSLITPTNAIQAGYRVVVTDYPDGGREAVTYWQPYRADGNAPRRRGRFPWEGPREVTDAEKAVNLRRNGRRAGSRVRRLVRQQGLRMMLTLTWPDPGQWDREEAMATVAYLLEKHGPLVHGGGSYLVVAEPHPGGHGWHIHVFTQVVWYKKAALQDMRIVWTGLLLARGWTLPPKGVTWIRTHAKRWKSARRAGHYAGKYAAKALGDAGRATRARRYTVSLGLRLVQTQNDAVQTRWWAALKHGGGRALVAWWRSWDEGEDPGGWPVAWFAWEPPRIRSPDSGRLVA